MRMPRKGNSFKHPPYLCLSHGGGLEVVSREYFVYQTYLHRRTRAKAERTLANMLSLDVSPTSTLVVFFPCYMRS